MNTKHFILPVIGLSSFLATYAVVSLWLVVVDNYALTKAIHSSENACISHWISQGVERVNILRSDGTCTIITNQGE